MVIKGENENSYAKTFEPRLEGQTPFLKWRSGVLCFDLVETIYYRRSERRRKELLNGYADLVSWAREAGVLTDAEVQQLTQKASNRPAEAIAVLRRAIAFREAIYNIFSAIAGGQQPNKEGLALLNAEVAEALRRMRVVPSDGEFHWGWEGEGALDKMLWPVAQSAAELLTSEDLAQVRKCAASECSSLFLDKSKNRQRRWCDMKVCGNRAKAHRHYARNKTHSKGDKP